MKIDLIKKLKIYVDKNPSWLSEKQIEKEVDKKFLMYME